MVFCSGSQSRLRCLQSQKYLPPGPLQKKLPDFSSIEMNTTWSKNVSAGHLKPAP